MTTDPIFPPQGLTTPANAGTGDAAPASPTGAPVQDGPPARPIVRPTHPHSGRAVSPRFVDYEEYRDYKRECRAEDQEWFDRGERQY